VNFQKLPTERGINPCDVTGDVEVLSLFEHDKNKEMIPAKKIILLIADV
jgi:hypothetical protein